MERKIKEEMSRIREEQKEKMNKLYSKDCILPEVEHLIEPVEVHELDDVIVTITGMDPLRMASAMGICVGENNDHGEEEEEVVDEEEESGCEEQGEEEKPTAASVGLRLKCGSVKIAKKSLSTDVSRTMRRFNAFKQKMTQEKRKKSKATKAAKLRREKVREKTGKRKNRPNSKPAYKR